MNKLKVCELIDSYYPVIDGAIQCAKHYTEQLCDKMDAHLAVPKAGKKDNYKDNEKFKVLRCLSFSAPEKYRCGLPSLDCKFKKAFKEENFQLLHTHSPFAMGRFALKYAKKNKIPVVATLHTQYHLDFLRTLKGNKALTKFMINYIMKVYKNADSVWTVSEKACECLRSYGYKGNIEVVRNGTDYHYPDNASELIDIVNEKHNLKGQENVFIFVGRMSWYKNIKLILDSLSSAKKQGSTFKALFVGGGFDLKAIIKYTEEIGLLDNCIFTDRVSDRDLLQGYYLRSDAMIFPSTFDTSGIVKVEAAAHKKACILIKDSCSAEMVEDGVNGFLCEENVESLSDVIVKLCSNPSLMKSAGDNAYSSIYRTWEDVAEEVYQKYQKIIKDYKEKHN